MYILYYTLGDQITSNYDHITLHYMYTGACVYTICAYSKHFKTKTHFGVQQFCAARGQNFVAADATRRGSRFRGRWIVHGFTIPVEKFRGSNPRSGIASGYD